MDDINSDSDRRRAEAPATDRQRSDLYRSGTNRTGEGQRCRSRRQFLVATGAAGAIALGSGHAIAHDTVAAETCASGGTVDVGGGNFLAINNMWGTENVDMCTRRYDDDHYGWDWSRGATNSGSPNYPEVLLGTKPWGTTTGAGLFPIRFDDIDTWDLTLDIDTSATGGNWNTALEWWHTSQRPGSNVGDSITHEIMLVLEWGDEHGHGGVRQPDAFTDDYGNSIDYWTHYDHDWSFHIFRVAANRIPGSLDLASLVEFLDTQVTDDVTPITADQWVSGVEIGNEYWDDTSGETTFAQFDCTLNGQTASSGSATDGSDGGTSDPIAEGTYRVTNANSGKFLEVANANTSDGANVRQYADTGHPCQEWVVSDNGDGTYRLENANSGKLLEVASANTSDGANVQQWGDTGHATQDWVVVDNGDGTYRLENANSGKVAEVYEGSTADGANVNQWSWNGGPQQRWTLEQV